jgi:hypothetical protein
LRASAENQLVGLTESLTGLHSDIIAAKEKLSHVRLDFRLNTPRSLEGIISYLTRKRGGNVHDEGIVTITSKSVHKDDPGFAAPFVADFSSDWCFFSTNEPNQWVMWDFHKRRVRSTHYTIYSSLMKSWMVEGSLDGRVWTELDRQTDNEDFKCGLGTASFAVSNSAECRFIRLTQTGKNHGDHDFLDVYAFEFFGTLLE